MRKIFAILTLVACFGVGRSFAADTTFVQSSVFQSGDCAPCSMTDSEYYLMTGHMAGDRFEVAPGSPLPLTVIDRTTGVTVPAIVTVPGPEPYRYGYMGPDMNTNTAMLDPSDSISMYSMYETPETVTVGGYTVQVNSNNRFRLLNRHYAPTRTAAVVPVGSVDGRTFYSRDVMPTNFASGLKEHSIPPPAEVASETKEQ